MDKSNHLALARLALSRGLVSLEGYSQVVIRLMNTDQTPNLEELWEGIATAQEIAELRSVAEMGQGETLSPKGISIPEQSLLGAPVDSIQESEQVITAVTKRSFLSKKPPSFDEGSSSKLQSRYELREVLGRGGMGFIQSAFDKVLLREVALKTLRPERQRDPIAKEIFWREARITGQLEHPQIMPVYDAGIFSSGELYYTMKQVRGTDLSQIIHSLAQQQEDISKRYSLYRLLSFFVQACHGIAYAHAQGVLHRDIKPANIMVGDFGEVLVLDWGLAIEPAFLSAKEKKRQKGRAVGTPGYMAPEQAAGKLSRMGPTSDVFSLGTVLYELLTLTPVVSQDEDPRIVIRRLAREPIEPPRRRAPERQIPGALEALCLWALEKNPQDRPRSATEFAEELSAFLEGSKERAKRREEASAREITGRSAAEEYQSLHQQAKEARLELAQLAESIDPFASVEQKRILWQKEEELKAIEAKERKLFGNAVRVLFQALSHDPDHRASRSALAQLYLTRLIAIEEAHGNQEEALLMNQMASTYDDGQLAIQLRGDGVFSFHTTPEEVQATLYRYEEEDRVIQSKLLEELTITPIEQKVLSMGSYMIFFQKPGHASVLFPFCVGRCESRRFSVRLPQREQVLPEFSYIPGGTFFAHGGQSGIPKRLEEVGDFFLQSLPVTIEDYLEFLQALSWKEGAKRLPRAWEEIPLIRFSSGKFVLGQNSLVNSALSKEQFYKIPITSISYEDAKLYAEWKSQTEKISFRLPYSLEWEKAARGTDGRPYPWGYNFDPSFCKHRDSLQEGPEPVGSFPIDTSPYGVRDCAGCVSEWMEDGPNLERKNIRGGSWISGKDACHLAYRSALPKDGHFRDVGFRLAYSL